MDFATWSEAVTAARESRLGETSEWPYSPRGDLVSLDSASQITPEILAMSWSRNYNEVPV